MNMPRHPLALTATPCGLLAVADERHTPTHLPNPDAVLIRICQQFAEAELTSWYRYCTAPFHLADKQDPPPEHLLRHWIETTPATTPEGWHAKALACIAWNREMYDDPEDERDGGTTLLASLLRDMVAPARNAILARCEAAHGPLPEGYTPDWRWVGRASA